jgi:hypothetical protein
MAVPADLGTGVTPAAQTSLSDLTPQTIDRFDRLKLELALLYHPDCTGDRADEAVKRTDVFHEIWAVLQKIEEEYRMVP